MTSAQELRLRRALAQRDVELATLLRERGLPEIIVQDAAPEDGAADGRIAQWLLIEGTRAWAACIGLTPRLLKRLGLRADERVELLEAAAAQLLAPTMGALRALCEDELQLRVLDAAQAPGDGPDVLTLGLRIANGEPDLLPLRLPAHLARRIAQRAEQCPALPHAAPVFLGHSVRLPVASLLALRVGDVLLAEASDADRRAALYFGGGIAARPVRLGTIRMVDGRIEHLVPNGWRAWAPSEGTQPSVALDVVLGHLTLQPGWRSTLKVGDTLPGWPVEHGGPPRLRLGGRPIADVHGTHVAGRAGFEILRFVDDAADAVPAGLP